MFQTKSLLPLLLAAALPLAALAGEYKLDEQTEKTGLASLAKGAEYLIAAQNEDGSWGKFPHPAIVALAAMAIHQAPGVDAAKAQATVDKALKYVLQFRQEDGSIFPAKAHADNPKESGYYPNYTTAIALLCLATINRPEDQAAMVAARKYLKTTQFTDKASVDYGGIGYGKTGRADLSNLSWSSEALYYTEYLDREPISKTPAADQKRNTEMWNAMQDFLTKVQNLPETNDQPYVNKETNERGGFIYRPFESKAGPAAAKENLLSSGSMTYAGLKSMLYARMKRHDVRVKGALEYLTNHYSLEENPGMGLQGLYYYLHVMTKALDAYGEDLIKTPDGKTHDWRQEVLQQFVKLQKEDGSWVNSNGRYFESQPELSTPYAVIAMKIALGRADLKLKE